MNYKNSDLQKLYSEIIGLIRGIYDPETLKIICQFIKGIKSSR